jgi:hypothetical protein
MNLASNENWPAWEASLPKTLWHNEANQRAISEYIAEFYGPDAVVTGPMISTAIRVLTEDGKLDHTRPPYTKQELLSMPRDRYKIVFQKYGNRLDRVLAGE